MVTILTAVHSLQIARKRLENYNLLPLKYPASEGNKVLTQITVNRKYEQKTIQPMAWID